MAGILTDIRDAIDRNYLVTKNMSNQVEAGTVVHIMDSIKAPDGSVSVNYRVLKTGQDFVVSLKSLKAFSKWARPDDFIARYHDAFSKNEILRYIKINSRTFASFYLPLILLILAVIWVLVFFVVKPTVVPIILGATLSVVTILVMIVVYKKQKTSIKINMYRKVSKSWGVSF